MFALHSTINTKVIPVVSAFDVVSGGWVRTVVAGTSSLLQSAVVSSSTGDEGDGRDRAYLSGTSVVVWTTRTARPGGEAGSFPGTKAARSTVGG